MTSGQTGTAQKSIRTLFATGPVGNLGDGQLLERFANHRDEAAFEALVERHGPMVLRVCRGVLADPQEAEDAFQATFLVLLRRVGSIRKRDSLASWLFGVAGRVAARARVDAARRRRHEQAAARTKVCGEGETDRPDPGPVLHEELARLPEKYREAVVLHYLEGQSCEEAATRLRRPLGTIKARLSRARGLLRGRLARRGLGLPAGLATAGVVAEAAPTALTGALLRSTVEAATRQAATANVGALTQGILRAMLLSRMKSLAAVAMLAGVAAAGAVVIAAGALGPAQRAEGEGPAPQAVASPTAAPRVEPALRVLEDARPAAEAISDPYERTTALRRVGYGQIRSGDLDAARATLRLAEQVAETVTHERNRSFALDRVAIAFARAGDVAAARQTFALLLREADARPPGRRIQDRAYTAMSQNMAGLRPDALETLKAALSVAEDQGEETVKAEAFYRIVFPLSEVGDFEGALALVERLQGRQNNMRQNLLQYIARGCQKADRATARRVLARALELSHSIHDEYPRALAQRWIAESMARTGDIPGALATARAIGAGDRGPFQTRDEIPNVLAVIAIEQAKAGDREAAKATLREALAPVRPLQDGVHKTDKLRQIAEAQAEIGDLDGARHTAVLILNDPAERIPALVAIARRQIRDGDKESARATLRDAWDGVMGIRARPDMINDDPTRTTQEALRGIALGLAEAGAVGEALAGIADRGDDDWKAGVLAELAPIQAREGDVAGALRTAKSIRAGIRKGEALLAVAKEQARTGVEADALAWASTLDTPEARAFALVGVAEGIVARRAEGLPSRPAPPATGPPGGPTLNASALPAAPGQGAAIGGATSTPGAVSRSDQPADPSGRSAPNDPAPGGSGRSPRPTGDRVVEPGRVTEVGARPEGPGKLRTVAGRVTDRAGEPVMAANVFQSGDAEERTQAETDAQGRFRLPGVAEGRTFLFVRAKGYRFAGRRVGAGEGEVTLTVTREGEAPEVTLTTLSPVLPHEEELALARQVLRPYAERALKGEDESDKVQVVEALARTEPSRVLELLERGTFADPFFDAMFRMRIVEGLGVDAPDEALAIAESIKDPAARAMALVQVSDALPAAERAKKLDLIARAAVSARGAEDPSFRLIAMGQVAEHWLDLGEADRGKAVLREGQAVAKELPGAAFAGYARGAFAEELAQVDLASALELTRTLGEPREFDRHHGNIAHELAGRDPAEAERILAMVRDQLERDQYAVRVVYRMAKVDLDRARRLSGAINDVTLRGFALGMAALGLAEAGKSADSASLLAEAFTTLERAWVPGGVPSAGLFEPAAVAAALLQVAERIDPRLVHEFAWRALSYRTPRPRVDAMSYPNASTDMKLASMLARYDRAVARSLLEPWVGPEAPASVRVGIGGLPYAAAAAIDPRWAVALVEALPDDPDPKSNGSKDAGRLAVAKVLSRRGESRWKYLHNRHLNLWVVDIEDISVGL